MPRHGLVVRFPDAGVGDAGTGHVLELVGVAPHARYAVFFPFDEFWESIDMADALHPQSSSPTA